MVKIYTSVLVVGHFLGMCLVVLSASCAHTATSNIEEGVCEPHTSELSGDQLILHPVSLEYLRVSGIYDAKYNAIADGIEMRINDPEQLRSYADYLRRLESFGNIMLTAIGPHLHEGDCLYWYELTEKGMEDIYREDGIAVVRDGIIVHKHAEHRFRFGPAAEEETAGEVTASPDLTFE